MFAIVDLGDLLKRDKLTIHNFCYYSKKIGSIFDKSSELVSFLLTFSTFTIVFQPIYTKPEQIICLKVPHGNLYLIIKSTLNHSLFI